MFHIRLVASATGIAVFLGLSQVGSAGELKAQSGFTYEVVQLTGVLPNIPEQMTVLPRTFTGENNLDVAGILVLPESPMGIPVVLRGLETIVPLGLKEGETGEAVGLYKQTMIGRVTGDNFTPHAFAFDTEVDIHKILFGGKELFVKDTNLHGVVCGILREKGVWKAFLGGLNEETPSIIDVFGATKSEAIAINDSAHVAGRYYLDPEHYHGFVHSAGDSIDLGTLGGRNSEVRDINNESVVVGSSYVKSGALHAFRWGAKYGEPKMQDLGVLNGDIESEAWGVNDKGQIVGMSSDKGVKRKSAFFWEDGKMVDLNTLINPAPGLKLERALDINQDGWIIGEGRLNGQRCGFLLKPIIPSS